MYSRRNSFGPPEGPELKKCPLFGPRHEERRTVVQIEHLVESGIVCIGHALSAREGTHYMFQPQQYHYHRDGSGDFGLALSNRLDNRHASKH
jgi:hypothetical protein